MPTAEKPLGVAILVCERVIVDKQTEKKTIVSTFNNIVAADFPCIHDRLSVFVALTNGQGLVRVALILKAEDGSECLKGELAVLFQDPRVQIDLVFNFRSVVFVAPGNYIFEVSADGGYVFEARFSVARPPPPN